MGVLFQSGALFTDLSVFDNVAFPLREHTRLPEPLIRTLVLMKLEAVGLRGARALMPSQLSGGMARRVALARAIALDPMMILYDEPFAGQDPISMGVLVKLIRTLNDALDLTSIIVSHDVKETAAIADYLYLISDGQVVEHGTPQDLQPLASPWVDQFMHALPDGPMSFHYPAPPLRNRFADEHSVMMASLAELGRFALDRLARLGRANLFLLQLLRALSFLFRRPGLLIKQLLHGRRAVAAHHPGLRPVRRHGAGPARLRQPGGFRRDLLAGHGGGAVADPGVGAGADRAAVRRPGRLGADRRDRA
jgi:energy-coupling factor transporter ATP-binding protein EcfA2